MASPELSPEQQKRATQIYKRAMWIGFGIYFGAIIVLSLLRVLHSQSSVAMGVMGGLASGVIRQFAEQRVSRVGLSLARVERHAIPMIATPIEDSLVFHSESAARLGRFTLLISGISLGMSILGQTGPKPSAAYLAGIVFSCALGMLSLYLMSKPLVLQLNTQGVTAWSSDFKPRRVAWDQVVAVEVQQPFDCMGKPGSKTLVFIGHDDVPLIKMPLAFPAILPEQVDEFIAQVEAKLRGESKISPA